MAILFGLYVNQSIEYVVKYVDNYTPSFEESKMKYELLERVLALGVGTLFDVEIKKDVAKLFGSLFRWEDDTTAFIVEDISNSQSII
jgi:hypothetical protein